MAKLNRESKLRDKRADKQARKAARKSTAAGGAANPALAAEALGVAPAGVDGGVPDRAEPTRAAAVADMTGGPA